MTQPLWKNRLKKHRRLGKSVEHYLWKGIKPFPALTPTLLGESGNSLFNVHIHTLTEHFPHEDND